MKKRIVFMMLIGMLAITVFAEEAAGTVAEDGDWIVEAVFGR